MGLKNDLSIPPITIKSGHIGWVWNYRFANRIDDPSRFPPIYQVSDAELLPAAQLGKFHEQFGHAIIPTSKRILDLSKTPYREIDLPTVVTDCNCRLRNCPPQNPIALRYISDFAGQAIFMDTFYPELSLTHSLPLSALSLARTPAL